MTELELFLKMLTRAGVGHGKRLDYNPDGTAVQVENENDEKRITDFWFNSAGELVNVYTCEENG